MAVVSSCAPARLAAFFCIFISDLVAGITTAARIAGLLRAGLFPAATGAADAEFFQDDFQRTEFRERRLQQVEADKGRDPEPVRAVVVRQQQAGQDEDAGEPADDEFHFHNRISWVEV